MTLQTLSLVAQANGLELSHDQLALLGQYAGLLQEKNQVVNLISRKDEDHILGRHILHSLTLAMPQVNGFAIPAGAMVFDIGTGGGLPGIPLKIVRPDLHIVLCDSVAKKVTAVFEFVQALGLQHVTAITGRAEELGRKGEFRGKFDVIVSRAVAPLDELVGWTKGLMKEGATLLSLKGGDLSQEILRTKRISYVADVAERDLRLQEYPDFASDEKKVVRVLMR